MVVEKLGIFQKILGAIGKRFLYNRSQKVNLYMNAIIVQSTIEEFKEIHGDYKTALENFNRVLETGVREIVSDLIDQEFMFGIGLKTLLSRTLSDCVFALKVGLWTLMGKKYKIIYSEPVWISPCESDNHLGKIVIKIKACPFCYGFKNIKNELDDKNFGDFIAMMMRGILQETLDYIGKDVVITCRETKCFMNGDEYGELELIFNSK